MKYDVFISYSRKDYVDEQRNVIPDNVISVIKDTFHQHGITYWMDEEGDLTGKKFAQVIASKIRESMVFLFVCTRNSVESEWVDRELSVAVERKKRIIPFVCDDSYKDDKVIMFTASNDRIEYFANSEKELERLVSAIEKDKKELEQKKEEAERQKQADEERRKKEELLRIEEQNRVVHEIRTACQKLNNEETKLLADRNNLLLMADKVSDVDKRAALKKDIQESSPIGQRYQAERLNMFKQIRELSVSVQKKEEDNKLAQGQWKEKDKRIAEQELQLRDLRDRNDSIVKKLATKRFHVVYFLLSLFFFAFVLGYCVSLWIIKDKNISEPYRGHQQEKEIKEAFTDNGITYTVGGVIFNMISVEGGTFQMGNEWGGVDEKPVHSVTVSDFYIGETEVTQELWETVMGSNPSNFKGSRLPVESVSWEDICGEDGKGTSPSCFLYKLNQLTGKKFRLPTEAEWEFAARGGNKSEGYTFSGSNKIDNVAWYDGNSCNKTHDVAAQLPNELGIYDMSGNVWEWCHDWYNTYDSCSQTNPVGPSSGSLRVRRGGCWGGGAAICCVASRYYYTPTGTYNDLGLRLAQ